MLGRRSAWPLAVIFVLFGASTARPIGMIAHLDQPGRTTEYFRPFTQEVGLSLSFSEIPLLASPRRGPQTETEINYHTGFIQIRTYYANRHINNPLALEILEFNARRSEGKVIERWRRNIRLSLGRAQFQKHGSGLQWEIIKVPKSVRAILGEGGVGLQVNGYRKITFSGTSRWTGGVQNTGSYRQSKFPSLDMKQTSRFTIKGNIGSKIHVQVDQDSKRETDLANRIQIRYKGDEDDILQSVELGNTTLNLPNTKFVGYSQRIQGLFGVKATAKLGDLDLTMITSQEKGNTEKTRFMAGASERVAYIRDYEYLKQTYYYVGMTGPDAIFDHNVDSIVDFKLFRPGSSTDPNASPPWANVYVDPDNTAGYADEFFGAYVELMENVNQEDYFLESKGFWIRLNKRLSPSNQYLAYWMQVSTGDSLKEVGSLGDTLVLKLLKPKVRDKDSPTWHYEWKNVYDLGVRDISYGEFEVDIYKGAGGTYEDGSNLNYQEEDSVYYLQLLGLDLFDDAGNNRPDGLVDEVDYLVDLVHGHIRFPNPKPFAPDPDVGYAPGFPNSRLNPRVPEIYTSINRTTLNEKSEYYLRIKTTTSRRSTSYSLGQVNILEGSETVTLNQRRLNRGTDYTIDYDFGQITFLDERALEEGADLTVDFEYAPFFSVERKSLFGARVAYSPGADFKIGSTFLYKGQKSTDRKAKLGQEKSRSMIGELDFSLARNPRWMTKLADAVPLVETSARSNLRLSGEVARSMPNPNTEGQVYIDDFEGARISTELGRLREYWTKCSPPTDPVNQEDSFRGDFIWYNPYHEFLVTDVYDREARHLQDQRMKVLFLRLAPESTESWGGVMRALYSGLEDQSRAQFLELRLGTYGEVEGKLHIDLGRISEDINGNGGEPDQEDRDLKDDDGNVIRIKNGILDPGEDTGLDGIPSEQESGYDEDTNPDPSGDDWYYNDKDPYNYEHINGTEGNGSGEFQDYAGRRPDTEDINGNEFLDQINDYEHFTIDLANSPFRVGGSKWAAKRHVENGQMLTFYTYRIPVRFDSSETQVRYARLWMNGMTDATIVVIAALGIVENRWGKPLPDDPEYTPATERFSAAVINTEENSESYYPPPGVSGYYDRHTDVREKEQSLLLKFEDFAVGDTGWATKTLNRAEDYTGYRYLRMFVHSAANIKHQVNPVTFIFRMGNRADGTTDYYECRVDLVDNPDMAWVDANNVFIDFDELTPLKETETAVEVKGAKERVSPDGTYKIRGNPTLTQIRYFAFGVAYKGGAADSVSGEIWVDEMRLDAVRRDPGTAARLSLTADFADLWSLATNYEYRSYSFRGLTGGRANLLNSSTRIRRDANARISLGKFLPASWRASLPVTLRYSKDVAVPKLRTGSDVVLTPELQKNETTTNMSYGIKISERMSLPTKHWLAKLTVNALSVSGSIDRKQTWSPRGDQDRESYTAKGNYKLSFKNLLSISPLVWTRYLLMPKKIWATKLNLLPKSFRASGNVNRIRGNSTNSVGVPISSYSRRFTGNADWSFGPFRALSGTYGFSTERDLSDPQLLRFSFNPRDFKLGRETKYSQRLGLQYKPPFLTFLSPSMTYSGDYKENSDPKRYRDGTRKVDVSSRLSAKASLSLKKLLGGKRGGKRSRKPATGRMKSSSPVGAPADSLDEKKTAPKEKAKSGGSGFRPHAPVLWLLRRVTNPLDPIKASYTHSETRSVLGLLERPPFLYRIGLISDHGVEKGAGAISGLDRDSEGLSDKYGLNSAINLFGLAKVIASYDYSKTTRISTTSTRRTSRTFPKLSTSIRKLSNIKVLNRVKLLRWVLDKSSAKFDYSHTFNESEKFTGGDAASAASWSPESESHSDRLGASCGLSQTSRTGWRITADYSWSMTRNTKENFTLNSYSETRKFTRTIKLSTRYSLKAPHGVRFPLLRKLRLRSSLNLNLVVRLTGNRAEKRADDNAPYTLTADKSTLTIEPTANYSFSSSMKGGFRMKWMDMKDKQTGRTSHTRQVSFWIEFRF